MKNLLLSSLLLFAFMTSNAQELAKFGIDENKEVPQGLTEGERAPNFGGVDQQGRIFELKKELENGPVVLVFYRGVWCGICSQHLAQLEEDLNALTEKGAQIVAVSPEVEQYRNETADKANVSFSLISDLTGEIMESYKVNFIVNEEYNKKLEAWAKIDLKKNHQQETPVLPVPATYIIAKDGTIKKVFFNPDYSKRANIEEILPYL